MFSDQVEKVNCNIIKLIARDKDPVVVEVNLFWPGKDEPHMIFVGDSGYLEQNIGNMAFHMSAIPSDFREKLLALFSDYSVPILDQKVPRRRSVHVDPVNLGWAD